MILFTTNVTASLLTVTPTGEVVWNVLSLEDFTVLTPEKSELEVKQVAGSTKGESNIYLKQSGGKIVLNVGNESEMDVTNWEKELIELTERGRTKKINISQKEGKFIIEQDNVIAETSLPISINPKENELSVVTDSGAVFLTVLPQEALETALRTKLVTKFSGENILIAEHDIGVPAYNINGEKELKVFNIFDLKIPVVAYISTTTGEVLRVDQPKWLSIVGYLFG
jgi:hypothetical protein